MRLPNKGAVIFMPSGSRLNSLGKEKNHFGEGCRPKRMMKMRKRYRVSVRKPIPSDLRQRVSLLHATAILKSKEK